MNLKKQKPLLWSVVGGVFLLLCLGYYFFFSAISTKNRTVYLELRPGDNVDSVYAKLEHCAEPRQMVGFKMLKSMLGYSKVKSGRYAITTGIGSLRLLRNLRNGRQEPVKFTVPNVRTMGDLAKVLSKITMNDSTTWAKSFSDPSFCAEFGYDTASLPCVFIPDTYDIYWDATPEKLIKRMKKESDAFWTEKRRSQAQEAGLTPNGVIIIASIVDQETANNAEKPMVAGMYINRFRQGMKLQADPTVKFALKNFSLRRIGGSMLFYDSPFNTYKYAGLPPGPICIPSLASIKAVLGYVHHNYTYMCAKEDFSGTHNFASTYEQQQVNARKYQAALNARGIK